MKILEGGKGLGELGDALPSSFHLESQTKTLILILHIIITCINDKLRFIGI